MFESDAIVEYIEEAYPPLEEGISPETKARNRAWSYLGSKNYLVQCSAQRSPDGEALSERGAKLSQPFDRIEKQLGEGPYFGGQDIGMVDIAWLPLLHRASIVEAHSGFDFLAGRPKLKKWQKTLLSDKLAEKSVSDDFHEAFSAFYLSDETYLGRRENISGSVAESKPASGCC